MESELINMFASMEQLLAVIHQIFAVMKHIFTVAPMIVLYTLLLWIGYNWDKAESYPVLMPMKSLGSVPICGPIMKLTLIVLLMPYILLIPVGNMVRVISEKIAASLVKHTNS